MSDIGRLSVTIEGDAKDLEQSLRKAFGDVDEFENKTGQASKNVNRNTRQMGKGFSDLRKTLTNIVAPAAAVALGIAKVSEVLKESIDAASAAQEVQSKFDTVFKDNADSVEQWADQYSDSIGRASTDTKRFLATLQDTFVPLGFAREEAGEMSKQLVVLANDLASFNDMDTETVVRDLQSALVGNTETLRKYGVVASQAAIEQEAINSGLIETKSELDAQTKAQSILQITMKGTADAQGDLERTQDSAANVQKRYESSLVSLREEMGLVALQGVTPLRKALANLVDQIAENLKQNREMRESLDAVYNRGMKDGVDGVLQLERGLEELQRREERLQESAESDRREVSARAKVALKAVQDQIERTENQIIAESRLLSLREATRLEEERSIEVAEEAAEAEEQSRKEQESALEEWLEKVKGAYAETTEGRKEALDAEIAWFENAQKEADKTKHMFGPILEMLKEQRAELEDTGGDGGDKRREELQGRLEGLRESLASEVELEQKAMEDKIKILDEAAEEGLISWGEYYESLNQIVSEGEARINELTKEKATERAQFSVQNASWLARNLTSIYGDITTASLNSEKEKALAAAESDEERSEIAEKYGKRQFEANKKTAIANALTSTFEAAVNAYKVGASIGGPITGAAFAATATAAGLAQVAKIRSQSWGGSGGGGASTPSASQDGGGAGVQRTLIVQGDFNQNDMFSGTAVRDLIDKISEEQRNGYTVVI